MTRFQNPDFGFRINTIQIERTKKHIILYRTTGKNRGYYIAEKVTVKT